MYIHTHKSGLIHNSVNTSLNNESDKKTVLLVIRYFKTVIKMVFYTK